MDISTLIEQVKMGNGNATKELIQLQRQGRALRLYPEGRRGPEDEGATPILMEQGSDMLVHIQLGRPCTVFLRRQQIGSLLTYLFLASSRMVAQRDQYDDSLVTPGFGYSTSTTGDRVTLTFSPITALDYRIGLEDCRNIITSWLTFIDHLEWDLADCNLTEGQYAVLNEVANDR